MKQPQGIIFVFLLIIGIVSAQRSGGGAGGGQQQQQQQPSPSAPSPSTTTETAAANSQTSSTSTSTTTSSTPTSTISTYNPPTFKMSLNTFPLAVSPLYGLSTCALSFNNMLLCSGLGADRGQNDRLGVNYTLVSPTSTLWQSGANFSSAWSLNWIAGSTTNINNSSNGGGGGGGGNATSQPFNNANISSNTQYLAMGAKRWQLGYEDQLFYVATPSYITVFDYAWSSPLTSSINQPRNIPLPSGGKVDMFSSLDSNGGAYAVVDGSSLFWVPIASQLSPAPPASINSSSKIYQFSGSIQAISLMQDSSTLFVAESTQNGNTSSSNSTNSTSGGATLNFWSVNVRSSAQLQTKDMTRIASVNTTQWPFLSSSSASSSSSSAAVTAVSGIAMHPIKRWLFVGFQSLNFSIAFDPTKNISLYTKIIYSSIQSTSFLDIDNDGTRLIVAGVAPLSAVPNPSIVTNSPTNTGNQNNKFVAMETLSFSSSNLFNSATTDSSRRSGWRILPVSLGMIVSSIVMFY